MLPHVPGLHVVDNTEVVLVAAHTALHLVEQVAQLHEDNQAGHGQPDVTKELRRHRHRCQGLITYSQSGNNTAADPVSSYQHMDMMHEIQKEHGQLHDEVCVVDVRPLALPRPGMVQIPQVNGVPEETCSRYSYEEREVIKIFQGERKQRVTLIT